METLCGKCNKPKGKEEGSCKCGRPLIRFPEQDLSNNLGGSVMFVRDLKTDKYKEVRLYPQNKICGRCSKPKAPKQGEWGISPEIVEQFEKEGQAMFCSCGRPTEYTKELGDLICSKISEGNSVRSIVNNEDMPSSSTIYRWLLDEDKSEFWEQYEKARNIQAEQMFEELLDIADDGQNDYIERKNSDGTSYEVVNSENIQRSRLRVDTRKWYLSKVLPKKFGEKIDMTSGGKEIPFPILNLDAILQDHSNQKDSEPTKEN